MSELEAGGAAAEAAAAAERAIIEAAEAAEAAEEAVRLERLRLIEEKMMKASDNAAPPRVLFVGCFLFWVD